MAAGPRLNASRAGGGSYEIPKTTIEELIRPRHRHAPVVLRVDRVSTVTTPEYTAYRLWLSDGEKSIQAIIKSEIYFLFDDRLITEGCHICLTDFELAVADKLNGTGSVLILKVSAMVRIELEYLPSEFFASQSIAEEEGGPSDERTVPGLSTERYPYPVVGYETRSNYGESSESAAESYSHGAMGTRTLSPSISTPRTPQKRKLQDSSTPFSRSSTNSPTPEAAKRFASTPSKPSPLSRAVTPTPQRAPQTQSPTPSLSNHQRTLPVARPLKLSLLSALTGPTRTRTATRNAIHDVLAVVTSVDVEVVRRRHLPPQRNLRIMDASTSKRVQLTVFVDAETFCPPLGTVALFRNVTTHEWDGGSLKAYQRDCKGKEWFVAWPEEVERRRVEALVELWRKVEGEGREGGEGGMVD